MAVIQRIRRNSALLIGVIALAMAGFIFMDMSSGGGNMFGGDQNSVAKINGKKISIRDYSLKVQQEIDNYQARTGQSPTFEQQESFRTQIWDEMMYDYLIGTKHEDLGVSVTDDELVDLLNGDNPHPYVVQSFSDPETGQFDRNLAQQYYARMQDPNDPLSDQMNVSYQAMKDQIYREQLSGKYSALLEKSYFAPEWLVNYTYVDRFRQANMDYVFVPASDIPAEVEANDASIKSYIASNPERFTFAEETRAIDYVTFDVVASREDSLNFKSDLEDITSSFTTAEDDSVFVRLQSENDFLGSYFTLDQLPVDIADDVFNAATGDVYGPYLDGVDFVLAKVMTKKLIPDSVQARHILRTVPQGITANAASDYIDSLRTLIDAGASFADLAEANSEDPGSAIKGGDLGFFKPGIMVQPFNDAVFFNTKQGDIVKIFTEFGVHLIEVTKSRPVTEAVRLARISRLITPSDETEEIIYDQASNFAQTTNDAEEFAANAAAEDLIIESIPNVRITDNSLAGLGNVRQLVKWVYNSKVGDISSVNDDNPDKFIVGLIQSIKEKGLADKEDVRGAVEGAVRATKYADQLKSQFAGVTDLNQIATGLSSEVKQANGVNFESRRLPEIGGEPELLGNVFSANLNELIGPIVGNAGVYFFKVTQFIEPTTEKNFGALSTQARLNFVTRVKGNALIEGVKRDSKIEDNRFTFY